MGGSNDRPMTKVFNAIKARLLKLRLKGCNGYCLMGEGMGLAHQGTRCGVLGA
jgi:hypothetical protein